MYIDMDQEPLFNQERTQELEDQKHIPITFATTKPIKIQRFKTNLSKVKTRKQQPTSVPNTVQPLSHPLGDTPHDTSPDDDDVCSDEEYDSIDDVSYSSCSTSSDQFKEPQFSQSYWFNSSNRNDSYLGNSVASSKSGLSLFSLNNSTFLPSSLISTPSTTTTLLTTTTSSATSSSSIRETDVKMTTPYLTPSSTPLSTFVSFETTNEQPDVTSTHNLRRTTSAKCLSKVLDKYQPKKSLYSNLTISLRALKDRLVTKAVGDGDVRIPPVISEEICQIPVLSEELPSQELITFFEAKHDHDTTQEQFKSSFKNRDHRINSQFLRLYAYDYNARTNSKTLPNSLSQEELINIILENPHLKQFHRRHNIYHISNLSREKLWNSVVLKPRQDNSPQQSVDYEDYICVDDGAAITHASLTRKHSKYLPWDLKPSIKPAGVLPGGKCELNGLAPNLGVSKTQYTVKGWCNSRWVAKTW